MPKQTIYELKIEQQQAIDAIEWCDTDEERIEALKALNLTLKKVENKLAFWIPLLMEQRGKSEQAKQAYKRFKEQHEANIKRNENNENWIENHVLKLMIDFNIDKFDTGLFKASHSLSPGSIELCTDFDIEKLPDNYVVVIPEHKVPDKKAMLDVLRDSIKDEKGKLLPDVQFIEVPELPGVLLDRKQSLRIR